MKLFKNVETLQEKITQMVKQLTPQLIKSITSYELYTQTFLSNFKV
ncbi:MAG: hypothetical protein GKR88_20495 [Flavobacteriaceae bacterium]|nr:MAG: hypothetical protein GKR88_20495 [Flavobacteriaceae bacterium]